MNIQTADDLSVQAGRVSAFNKALSGGGYGPLVAGGQMAIGIKSKNAVGITDLAEAPICLSGFLVWCWLQGFPPLDLAFAMCIGAGLAPAFRAGRPLLAKLELHRYVTRKRSGNDKIVAFTEMGNS